MGNSASHSMFAEDNDGEETSSWGFPLDLILKAERLPTAMTLEEKAIYRQQGKNDRSSWFFSFFSFIFNNIAFLTKVQSFLESNSFL